MSMLPILFFLLGMIILLLAIGITAATVEQWGKNHKDRIWNIILTVVLWGSWLFMGYLFVVAPK